MSNQNAIVTPVGKAHSHAGLREFVLVTGDENPLTPAPGGIVQPATPRVRTGTIINLIAACRAADRDIERLGVLTASTVDMIRDALAEADAS